MNHFGTPGVASRWSVGLRPTWTGLAMCVVLGALCSWAGRSMAKGESTPAAAEGRALVALRVNVTGQGAVRSESGIDCGAVCRTRLPAGTSVVLNAEPAVGQRFVGWAGACSGAAACSVTLEQTQLVGAIFSPIPAARFSERPYLFKADEVRLRASMAANDPEAFGSTQNIPNAPIGFLTLAQAAYANRSSYSDVPTWHIAMAGWLLNNTAMQQRARDEAMAIVAAAPSGDTGSSEAFQHVEDRMLNVAAVADLAYSQFSAAQLMQVANFVNGTLSNWNKQNTSFWPYDEPLNNYWQNGFLAHVVGGIATQGFNSQAAAWRTGAQTMAGKFINRTTVGWSGPVQTEGHYYAGYVNHAFWAMELYDAALGTSYLAQSKFSPAAQLDLLMYQTRPNLVNFFEVGSEANDSKAPFTSLSVAYWHHLISSGRSTEQAQQAKAILLVAMASTLVPRWTKSFSNFYWNIYDVPEVSLTAKSDRMYAAPTPGAGLIGVRSAAGFQTNARAALMFATQFNAQPAYSHANPDAPGFQWGDGADWLVADPEYFNSSGILAEGGPTNLSDISNIVTLAGHRHSPKGAQPRTVHAEDNRTASVSHFYVQIDAQPYWNMTSTYRRDYVWLDDLRVVLVWDRIVGIPAKKWRLHVAGQPVVDGAKVSYIVNGLTVTVRDLLAPSGGAWRVEPVLGVWRISQDDPSNDYRSLKVLDAGGRIEAASMTHGQGWHEAVLTLDGRKVATRFYDDGRHATVNGETATQSGSRQLPQ